MPGAARSASLSFSACLISPAGLHFPAVNDLSLLLPLLSFLAGVIVLRAIAAVTGGITFDSWGAAIGTVLIAYVVGFASAYVKVHFALHSPVDTVTSVIATNGLVQLAVNFVSLVIAGAVLSGVHLHGALGLTFAAIALTVVNVAMAYLPLVMPEM